MRNVLIILSFFGCVAQAAQTGKVITDRAAILEYPMKEAKKLKEASKGESLTVSNLATEGFYKVRLGKDEYGWISGNDIFVENSAARVMSPVESTVPVAASAPEPASEEFSGDRTRILLGMGVQDLAYGGLTDQFMGASDLNLGQHYSLELQRKIHYLLYWSLRAEILNAESGEQAISATTTQTMKSHSVPVQIGVLFHPIHARKFRLGLGVYVGASLITYTQIEQTTSAQTNSVKYSSIDPIATLAVQGTYGFGKRFGVFGELSYRYHSTGTLDESAVLDPLNPVPAFKLNYSGIFLKGGLEFRF